MSDKKFKPRSISLEDETYNRLKVATRKLGLKSLSELIRKLSDKYLDILTAEEEIPVILRIPMELRGNEQGLRDWFAPRIDAAVKKLGKNEADRVSQTQPNS